ncbi:MAG: beta-N-acetylhexosaminidase [Anaerolineales bacterium]|nr:beta-N-acetylhexosaminidase [Anaerolineales bacterium]
MPNLIPQPVSITLTDGAFSIAPTTVISVPDAAPELTAIGQYLADSLIPPTGFDLQVQTNATSVGYISLALVADPSLGDEGYHLTITPETVTLTAHQPAGLFWGVQTLRQLLPPAIESASPQPGPWTIPTGEIRDHPRFAWRGVMLDVARHFFSVDAVKRYIDLAACYKINRFHLHLSDDQGWRIEIKTWPNLTAHGGSTEVGGGPGGYYTQAEYADLVAYAQARYMVVIPEIDLPGHTNAALASYPELNGDGKAPDLYTGTEVGFSSLCVDKEITYQFLNDVLGELAALTPGPYLHIGGDEAAATPLPDYVRFVERVETLVAAHGKQMIGWEEVTRAELNDETIAQLWTNKHDQHIIGRGGPVILSPAFKTYLDMKYTATTTLGLRWAGLIEVADAYAWEPNDLLPDFPSAKILGIEAPLWSETLEDIKDIEFMAFPRLPGYAEIGWSPQEGRAWDEYRLRLAAHGPRWQVMNLNFYRSSQIPWE